MAGRVAELLAESMADCVPAEPRSPSIPPSLTYSEASEDQDELLSQPEPRTRRPSVRLIDRADVQSITGESTAQLLTRCCGGGCCTRLATHREGVEYERVTLPDNDAFRSLHLRIPDEIPCTLSEVPVLPPQTTFLEPLRRRSVLLSPTDSGIGLDSSIEQVATDLGELKLEDVDTTIQPPSFVQPHYPYNVFAARIHDARELTKPGAEKRTYHFDLDVTGYPDETGVDFKVGGAIGVMAPNDSERVDEVMDLLMIPRVIRDKPVLLRTTGGRWPTVWGEEKARQLVTTRRALLTWCSDIQSYPPTKPLLRLLAEHAADDAERKVLLYLCSAEGQGLFCDFRTGPHVTLSQLLHAFPSSHPPLDHLFSVLQPLMPRFYSLSNDPHHEATADDGPHVASTQHRIIEIAVTVHETADWAKGIRTGVGSGFFERQAQRFLAAKQATRDAAAANGTLDLDKQAPSPTSQPQFYVPMFKGLMSNPLAKQFVGDGPMLLIGAGVGIAPFRGFVQRRLRSANCANKVWVLQGIRDCLVDELYSGEWGVHEDEVKRVVESRRGTGDKGGRYVQEEVRAQADLVWYIANSVDGRIFVCGSTKGMGEGVHEALIDVAMRKGNLERDEATRYWELKKEAGQYIAETW